MCLIFLLPAVVFHGIFVPPAGGHFNFLFAIGQFHAKLQSLNTKERQAYAFLCSSVLLQIKCATQGTMIAVLQPGP
jgi:hypothetical protein